MKEKLKKIAQLIFLATFMLVLQACGGSGSSGQNFSISTNITSINLSNEIFQESTKTIKVEVNFKGKGLLVGFAPDTQPAAWLNYRTSGVTETSATLYIDVVNAQFLPPNTYKTILRLSTGDATGPKLVNVDIDISLLVWQLSLDKTLLSFNDTFGVQSIPSQTFAITSDANQWQASTDVDWLSLDVSEGTGGATITVTPDISQFTQAGLSQANVILTEKISGDKKILPVELGLDNVYLYADKASIAFSSTPNIDATQSIITIGSNNPKGFNWQAQSSAEWLTLTPIDGTDQLKITADASLITDNELSMADIIISPKADPENPTAESPIINETVKVSLYKSDLIAKTQAIKAITANTNAMVIAPLQPYVYIGVGNELRIYHQYSAELISSTVIAPENTLLEQFVIHPQGHLLIAKAAENILDANGDVSEVIVHRYKINLDDLSFSEIAAPTIQFEPVQFVRFAGRYFIVTQILEYADENLTQLALDGANAFFARAIDTAPIAQSLFAFDASSKSFKRYTAKINDFTTEKISTTLTHEYIPENLGETDTIRDFIVTSDEKNIYAYSPTSEWISFDGTDFIDHGLLETNPDVVTLAIEKSSNSRPHYVRFDPSQGFIVNVYDEQQKLSATIPTGGSQPTSIKISADDQRLIINASGAETIEMINLQQFNTSTNQLNFNTTLGNTTVASQNITLSGISPDWQATSNVSWLVLSQDNSGEQPSLTVNIDPSSITTWGLLTGTITIYDPASGTSTVITVKLAVDEVRLSSNYPALAFNSLATQQTLTHTVDILTNRDSVIAWQANSNVNWLTLTADAVNNQLTVTVDPSKVTSNGISYAEITISPVNSDAALGGTINVSINKADNDATNVTISNVTPNTDGSVLDPLRPFIYLAIGDSIKIYNIISGDLITTINSPLAGVDLSNLVIYPDGSLLLMSNKETVVDDQGVSSTIVHHYQMDLNTQTIIEIDNAAITIEFRPLMVQMIAGKPVVITQTLEFADTHLVRQSWDQANAYFAATIAAPASKDTFMVFKNATNSLEQYQLTYNAFAEQTVNAELINSYTNSAFTSGISALALSKDNKNIYTINNNTEWSTFDGSNFTDQGLLDNGVNISAFNVTTDSSDNSYFYRFDPTQGFVLTTYDNKQNMLSTQPLSSGSAQSYLAPDYQRVLSYNTSTATFTILSIN